MTVDQHLEADIAWLSDQRVEILPPKSFPREEEINARIDRLIARAGGGQPDVGLLRRLRAEALSLTLKHGSANGDNYHQGVNDHGKRWVDQLDAAINAEPLARPVPAPIPTSIGEDRAGGLGEALALSLAAPWPAGGASNNSKRVGWAAFFGGKPRDKCPFPPARNDMREGFEYGWDAAQAHKADTLPAPVGGDGAQYVISPADLDELTTHAADASNGAVHGSTTRERAAWKKFDAVVERVKSSLAPPPTPESPEGWRRIETAPRDGTEVLASVTGAFWFQAFYEDQPDDEYENGWWTLNQYYEQSKTALKERAGRFNPTVWVPIPAATKDGRGR